MSKVTQYNKLAEDIYNNIKSSIALKGVQSKHCMRRVIPIKTDNLMFNLEGGRYLAELSSDELIDNLGYHYDYSVLNLEQLAQLADYCTKRKTPKAI